jgi:hypothetical protein
MTDTTYHVTFLAYLDAVEAFIMIISTERWHIDFGDFLDDINGLQGGDQACASPIQVRPRPMEQPGYLQCIITEQVIS